MPKIIKNGIEYGATPSKAPTFYGISNGSGSDRIVQLVNGDGFVLATGVTIHVKFADGFNGATPPMTLNVNGTGPKPVYWTSYSGRGYSAYVIQGQVCALTYDGFNWVINDGTQTAIETPFTSSSGLSSVNVQGAIDEIVNDLKGNSTPLFKIINFASSNITVPANGAVNVTATNMNYTIPTGYTPIGICGWYIGSNDIFARSLETSATGSSSFCVLRNVSSTAYTGALQARVVFVKTTYI